MGHNIYFVNSIKRHLEKTRHKFLGRGGLFEVRRKTWNKVCEKH